MESTVGAPRHFERLAIVGAGPAGLTAALAAKRLGFTPVVFEQAVSFRRLGGGLLLQSNGLRALEALGLLDALHPHLCPLSQVVVESPPGHPILAADFRELSIPYNRIAVILRYNLQNTLLEVALGEGVDVRFDRRCEGVLVDGEGATLRFGDGEEEFDAVLACDGIHSAVRRSLRIPTRRRDSGEAYLRGVAERAAPDDAARELWGRDGRRFGFAPLPGERTYFYCSVPRGEWREIRALHLEAWLAGWAPFGREVKRILEAVPDWDQVNYAEAREIRARRWHAGPAFLVGDAAHAMLPDLGQGANSAMVDALVVVRLLARMRSERRTPPRPLPCATFYLPALPAPLPPLEQVGRSYEALRKPFVTRIQRSARQVGTVASWTLPPARWARDALIRLTTRLPPLRNRMLTLTAGVQEGEQSFLS